MPEDRSVLVTDFVTRQVYTLRPLEGAAAPAANTAAPPVAAAAEPPSYRIAFSNVGGVETGAERTDAAIAAIGTVSADTSDAIAAKSQSGSSRWKTEAETPSARRSSRWRRAASG